MSGTSSSKKFSVSMEPGLVDQIDARKTERPDADGRSQVLSRDINRLYNGIYKQGLRTLRKAQLTQDERACLGTVVGTAFDPATIPLLVFSLEAAKEEIPAWGIDPDMLIEKVRALDTASLYTLVDLLERGALEELA